MRRLMMAGLLALATTTACSNAGKDIVVPGYYSGSFNVHAFIDSDGDSLRSGTDLVYPGLRVTLYSMNGHDTLEAGVTNELGRLQFRDLPLGSYRFSIDGTSIGDSLIIVRGDSGKIRLLARLDSLTDLREILLSYPILPTAQARLLPPGRRVVIRGKVLAPPQLFHDGQAFISDASGAIRLATIAMPEGITPLAIGDSVLLVGVTGTDRGQVVLNQVTFKPLGAKPLPVSRISTVTEARTAGGGTLDAALVQVSGVTIADTAMVNPDFEVTLQKVGDPSDRIVVVLDQLLDVVHASYAPGNNIVVRGVLVPRGDGTWVIRPRTLQDITFP